MQKQNTFPRQTTIVQHADEVRLALAKHGAHEYTIRQVEAQLSVAQDLEDQHADTIAEAEEATQSLHAVHNESNKLYDQHVLLAREAFKDNPVWLEKMELVGPRPKSLPAWIRQASSFYRHAPAVQDILAAHQIPAQEVAEMQKLLTQMIALRALQVDLKGRAQVISRQKKRANTALRREMAQFYRFACITHDKEPPHLKRLGLIVKASV